MTTTEYMLKIVKDLLKENWRMVNDPEIEDSRRDDARRALDLNSLKYYKLNQEIYNPSSVNEQEENEKISYSPITPLFYQDGTVLEPWQIGQFFAGEYDITIDQAKGEPDNKGIKVFDINGVDIDTYEDKDSVFGEYVDAFGERFFDKPTQASTVSKLERNGYFIDSEILFGPEE